jgi:predicted DNA-binding transcriptional regulator AlpA
MPSQQRPSLVVRKKDLPRFIGKRRTQIDEMIKRGEFPPGTLVSDGRRARIWTEDEILAWQQSRFATREAAK